MPTSDPLATLKKQLLDFSAEEMSSYIEQLGINRLKGPEPVKRSKETGRPTGGKSMSPLDKLEKILSSMGEGEREAFLAIMKENKDASN